MNIAVFLSQYDVAGKYAGVVEALGKSIAERKHTLIFGGCNEGLMHLIAQTVHDGGAKVIGVIRAPIEDKAYPDADEMHVVKDAHEMNVGLIERADCIVVLAGGIGTLNELTAIVRMKKNAEHDTKTVIVNTGGFYDGLKAQLERMHAEGFLREDVMQSVHFVSTPEEAMGYIEAHGS